jgi:NCAIR mutase (PurE)-related protein
MLEVRESSNNILITRGDAQILAEVKKASGNNGGKRKPGNGKGKSRAIRPTVTFHPLSRVIAIERNKEILGRGTIAVVSAGTSDIPVAEEALLTARMMGNRVESFYDVGVAGIHRLLEHRAQLAATRVIICVAGMEGALPSVVGGLVGLPVIAVPTSVGYGASFGGVAALLGMLNSCASNVCVVNIDNGFGAGCVASVINRL